MIRIAVYSEGEEPQILEFQDARQVTFGRAAENDIVLTPTYISRSHGEFFLRDGVWHVVNHRSMTGLTLVRQDAPEGGVLMRSEVPEPLQGGETLQILNTLMRVELKPEDSLDDTEREWQVSPACMVAPLSSTQLGAAGSIRREFVSEGPKLEMLLELTKDLNRLEELDEVLERISRTVFESLPKATHFSVGVCAGGSELQGRFGATREGAEIPQDQIAISQSIVSMAIEREVAVLFHSSDNEISMSESILMHRIGSSMAIPLRGSRGMAGVMQVDNRSSAEPFSQADLDFGVVLANSAAYALERAQFQDEIRKMFEGFVDASVTAIEARDPTTSGHSRRVARFSVLLAEAINRTERGPLSQYRFEDWELTELSYSALLHDFGKVGVPECVLVKSSRLYPEQLERILTRFQLIRASSRNAVLREALTGDSDAPPPEEIDGWIDAMLRPLRQDLEETEALILEINKGGPLSEEQLGRLQRIGEMTFVNEKGEEQPFLIEEELESLCIPRGTLTEAQRREIESHVTQSHKVLMQIRWHRHLERVPQIVVTHHEKLDGSGYPRGLRGPELLPQARLLTVCDIFDAVTASDRPYRSAMPIERGLDLLRDDARNGKIDSDMVELFIKSRVWEHQES